MVQILLAMVVLAFTILGITFTVVYLDGPYDIITRVRRRLTVMIVEIYDADGDVVNIIEEPKEGFFNNVLHCYWCTSLWITIIIVIVYGVITSMTVFEVLLLCASSYGLSGFMYEIIADG